MAYKKKFKKGEVINSITYFEVCRDLGYWFYFGSSDRPKHHTIISNMKYHTVSNAIKGKRLWLAVLNKEES